MTPEQFCYWIQGFAELNGDTVPSKEQWQAVRDHLKTVFKKETPELPAILRDRDPFGGPKRIC
jgi:hypothetical protein